MNYPNKNTYLNIIEIEIEIEIERYTYERYVTTGNFIQFHNFLYADDVGVLYDDDIFQKV